MLAPQQKFQFGILPQNRCQLLANTLLYWYISFGGKLTWGAIASVV